MKSHWQADRVGNIIKGLFIFHISCFAFAPILFCCVQFCLPRFIFLHFLSRSYFNLFSLLTSTPPPPPSPPSHPPNICVKSLSMPRPGSVGHIRTPFPLFFPQKESSSPERWSKTSCFLLFWPRYAFPLCRHPERPLMMQRSRRRHKHAASPAEHLSSYKSMSAMRTGVSGGAY